MDEQLEKCIEFAKRLTRGKKKIRAGNDYILHPLRPMEAVETTEEKLRRFSMIF